MQYGANVWWDIGSNLKLERTYYQQYATQGSSIYKDWLYGSDGNPSAAVAITTRSWANSWAGDCNLDAGRPITQMLTAYNKFFNLHEVCELARAQNGFDRCYSSGTYDVQNVAAHEFGHWHRIRDSSRAQETMYAGTYAGETQKRSLDAHDVESALIMYGRR